MIYKNGLIRLLEEMADKAFDECEEHTIRGCVEIVKRMPTIDAVEVVRCMDCKHFSPNIDVKVNRGVCEHNATTCWLEKYDDDFCSYGERREENADD